MITISEILKGSEYSLTQFCNDKIIELENSIVEKELKGKPTPYIKCLVRNKEIKLTPEEIVRQLYIMVLTKDFHYPVSRMELLPSEEKRNVPTLSFLTKTKHTHRISLLS